MDAPTLAVEKTNRILIYGFDVAIPRPVKHVQQKRFYSGKKKRHTLTTQVAKDATREVPAADKKINESQRR
jgi:hypothetical protein